MKPEETGFFEWLNEKIKSGNRSLFIREKGKIEKETYINEQSDACESLLEKQSNTETVAR
jgi:hypothetical protein